MTNDRIKEAANQYEEQYSLHQIQAANLAKQIATLEERREAILDKPIFKTIHRESDGDYYEFRNAVAKELGRRYYIAIKE